ncbi:MAG: superoxide dismutase [Xanthomonadales bacterium]|nr:superoxide dismutase [Xanthomonadales bacterium]ODU74330.1 MAG: superoxide dismutase [Rhodanobacter sp. SCN 69-32]OJY84125.1 MAG: superoxide dismutase [Xanthomonadales bacterium 66-474]
MNAMDMPALAGQHVLKPLPFAANRLRDLSERLIVSHHENNYGGAVRNLNKVEAQLAQITKDTPPFVVGGLRQHELMYRNSATLHEAYFGNLGGDGQASGGIVEQLAAGYGSYGNWETQFRLTGASLSGGSGWAILAFELLSGYLRTFWSGHHTQVLATSLPLLVMDMYEHSYQMDYGAAAAKYIDAFFVNIQWDEVNRRLEQAHQLHRQLCA